jgi:hypothetical protein
MVPQGSLLVLLVGLVDLNPARAEAERTRSSQGVSRPIRFEGLVMMIVRQVHTPSGLLAILAQPSAEMQALRQQLTLPICRFACRRTWERRLAAIPETLPAQIACLGGFLVASLSLWAQAARAAAIDSTVLIARGGVGHKKDREANTVPHPSIGTEAHWTESDWHG